MIRRTTPHTITQNQVLSEESFTGKKGIDITQAPVVRDTVEDLLNLDIDLDGAMTIRKPIKSLDAISVNLSNCIYSKNLFDDTYLYLIKTDSSQIIRLSATHASLYLKDGDTEVNITNSNLIPLGINIENAIVTNMNTSSLLSNVNVNLLTFKNGSHYDSNIKKESVYMSFRIYKETSTKYILEFLDPYIPTLEASETISFNPNTAGMYTYALKDIYNSYAVKVNGILAYTNGTAETVKGLTETDSNGHYIISSINDSYNNPIILKAFCNFIKDTPSAKYYCAWEYSFDNVIWETLPEFKNKWSSNPNYTLIKVQNLGSIDYTLSTDIKTVYNTVNKEVVSLNIVDNDSQLLANRPDIINLNSINKAVYRFVIYRQYEYYNSYTSKRIIKLADTLTADTVEKSDYNFTRIVDTNDNTSQNFELQYTVPAGFSEANLTCKMSYATDGSSLTEVDVPITITTISETNNAKVINITNTDTLTISPPTVNDYVGQAGKSNVSLKFYYVNNMKFDILNYQIVYIKNSNINRTYNIHPALISIGDNHTITIDEMYMNYKYYFTIEVKFDTSATGYLISNSYNPSDRENYDINQTVYSISTYEEFLDHIGGYTVGYQLYKIPYFNNTSPLKTIHDSLTRNIAVSSIQSVVFVFKDSYTNTTVSTVGVHDIPKFIEECDVDHEVIQGGFNTWKGYKSDLPHYGRDCIILNALVDSDANITPNITQYMYADGTNKQYYIVSSLTTAGLKTAIKADKFYNNNLNRSFNSEETTSTDIANTIGLFEYTMQRSNTTEILNVDFINSNKGKKLYYKYRLYSYGDSSFKNNIFVSNTDSLITPLFNAIDLPITDDSIITTMLPWREYLIAASTQGIFLITPTGDGFTSKILSTFVGIPEKDSETLKATLNGAIFKSGSKIYLLQPSIYASSDNTINIIDISKPIAKYLVDTTFNNFAFTTEQFYYLCIPNTTYTTVLKYEYATKRWTKHKYPVRFIDVHIVSLDDIRIITETKIYQFDRTFDSYIDSNHQYTGYGDILNSTVTPIEYEINTGPKSYSMQYPHQFVETKILFGVLDDSNAQLPLQVDIYSDNFKNILHIDPSTSNTLWRDTVAPRTITNVNNDFTVLTLNSDLISDEKVTPILKQLFLRYSGKGFTVTHHLKGQSNCNFKCYVIYVRFKETTLKK